MKYEDYELSGADIGELLDKCLSEMSEATSDSPKWDFNWNPTNEQVSRWATLLFSQWLIGKFEDESGISIDTQKNPAIKKYIKIRAPQIFAYIESIS